MWSYLYSPVSDGSQSRVDVLRRRTELESVLEQVFVHEQQFLDLKALCIIPYHKCIALSIDCSVDKTNGNLIDHIALAIREALLHTCIPCTTVVGLEDSAAETSIQEILERDTLPDNILFRDLDFVVDGDKPLPVVSSVLPHLLSIHVFGTMLVIDPCAEEEMCKDYAILFSYTNGKIQVLQTVGSMSITATTLLHIMERASSIPLYQSKTVHV